MDPVQSREHILLSNLFQTAWSQGKNMPLEELIMQIQTPPFTKLGVMDVETLFREKDRGALAMRMNNMLASPSFQTWMKVNRWTSAGCCTSLTASHGTASSTWLI
ncbi:MAG: hypothetical protein R3C44_10895 [Chloroflexota bacterium]